MHKKCVVFIENEHCDGKSVISANCESYCTKIIIAIHVFFTTSCRPNLYYSESQLTVLQREKNLPKILILYAI